MKNYYLIINVLYKNGVEKKYTDYVSAEELNKENQTINAFVEEFKSIISTAYANSTSIALTLLKSKHSSTSIINIIDTSAITISIEETNDEIDMELIN